jgi:hypothetical protein
LPGQDLKGDDDVSDMTLKFFLERENLRMAWISEYTHRGDAMTSCRLV